MKTQEQEANRIFLERRKNPNAPKEREKRYRILKEFLYDNDAYIYLDEEGIETLSLEKLMYHKDFSFGVINPINANATNIARRSQSVPGIEERLYLTEGEWKITIFHKGQFFCSIGNYEVGNSADDWDYYFSFDSEEDQCINCSQFGYSWETEFLERIKSKMEEQGISL